MSPHEWEDADANELLLPALPPANKILKVHLWEDNGLGGFREKKLYSVEGFAAHPRTTLVDSPEDADVIVWVTVRGRWEAEVPPSNYSNVVLLDYADGCNLHQKRGELKHMIGYFKRSFVQRVDGSYTTNCTAEGYVRPLAYSGVEVLINRDVGRERNLSVTNVLRTGDGHNTVRTKIVLWTRDFVEQHGLGNQSLVENVGSAWSGSNWDTQYQAALENSKIIVTCNPMQWEGDFRLWEALLSGAMVMVDRMAIPGWMPHPFVHRRHLVYYDPHNRSEFEELLEYYVRHEDEARRIGEAGYRFVLEHHMPKDRVTYILDAIDSKIETDGKIT